MSVELSDEAIEKIGTELHRAMGGKTMGEHIEGAEEILHDDDTIAYALVAIRHGEDGIEHGAQRVIDPDAINRTDMDGEDLVELLHKALCSAFDQEIRDRD